MITVHCCVISILHWLCFNAIQDTAPHRIAIDIMLLTVIESKWTGCLAYEITATTERVATIAVRWQRHMWCQQCRWLLKFIYIQDDLGEPVSKNILHLLPPSVWISCNIFNLLSFFWSIS